MFHSYRFELIIFVDKYQLWTSLRKLLRIIFRKKTVFIDIHIDIHMINPNSRTFK
jgi:hypothetical protein